MSARTSRLKVLRIEAQMTQRDLSAESGVDVSYISQLETRPDMNVSLRIARRLRNALTKRLGRWIWLDELFPDDQSSSSQATKTA